MSDWLQALLQLTVIAVGSVIAFYALYLLKELISLAWDRLMTWITRSDG